MERRERKDVIHIRIEPFLRKIIEKLAAEREMQFSEMARNLLVEGIKSEKIEGGLTELEKQYAASKRLEVTEHAMKYLRGKNAEKIFFIKNIKKQMYLYAINRKDIQLGDVLKNMKWNLEIARNNGWVEEEKKIEKFLTAIETENPDMLDGENNEKKLEEGNKVSGV